MPRYQVDEDIYNISDEEVDVFLDAFPNAVLLEEIENLDIATSDISGDDFSFESDYSDIITSDRDEWLNYLNEKPTYNITISIICSRGS